MANNWVQFSTVIDCLTEENRELLMKRLDNFVNDEGDETTPCIYERQGETFVWLACGDYFENGLVDLIEAWTEEVQHPEPVGFSWAYGCDKLRADEFGGGAVVIYKGLTKFVDTQDFIYRAREEIKNDDE